MISSIYTAVTLLHLTLFGYLHFIIYIFPSHPLVVLEISFLLQLFHVSLFPLTHVSPLYNTHYIHLFNIIKYPTVRPSFNDLSNQT
jgi:hypothetical protein